VLAEIPEFVIPNGVCEVKNLSFLGLLIEEGFIAQKTCDGKSYLASLGMTGNVFSAAYYTRLKAPDFQTRGNEL